MTMRIAPRYLIGLGLALLGGVCAAFLPWQEGHAEPPPPEVAKPMPEDAAAELGEARGEVELLELQLATIRDHLRNSMHHLNAWRLESKAVANDLVEATEKDLVSSYKRYLKLSRELGRLRHRAAEMEAKLSAKRRGGAAPGVDTSHRLEEIERRLDALSREAERPKE